MGWRGETSLARPFVPCRDVCGPIGTAGRGRWCRRRTSLATRTWRAAADRRCQPATGMSAEPGSLPPAPLNAADSQSAAASPPVYYLTPRAGSRRPAVEPHYAKSGLDGAFNLVRSRIPAKTSLRGSRPAAEPAVHVQTKSDGQIGRARTGWATQRAARGHPCPRETNRTSIRRVTHVLKLYRTPSHIGEH